VCGERERERERERESEEKRVADFCLASKDVQVGAILLTATTKQACAFAPKNYCKGINNLVLILK